MYRFILFSAFALLCAHPLSAHFVFAQPEMDTIKPTIQCPPSHTYTLTGASCDTILQYTVLFSDNQPNPILIQLSGLPSGAIFPPGQTINAFLVTDQSGNTATCSFTVVINGNTPPIVCKDLINIGLNAACTGLVTAAEVLDTAYGCFSPLLVELDKTAPMGNGPWVQPTLNQSDLNKTYQVRITDPKTGNKCWGNVKVEDKGAPALQCQNVIIPCYIGNTSTAYLKDSLGIAAAMPSATDACGGTVNLVESTVSQNLPCDSAYIKILTRTWTATDAYNNSSSCVQKIKLRRQNLNELVFPADTSVSCTGNSAAPELTGLPYVLFNGHKTLAFPSLCADIGITYSDSVFYDNCSGLKRLKRKWLAIDCTDSLIHYFQRIDYRDGNKPTLTCPPNLTLAFPDVTDCEVDIDLPNVLINDFCSRIENIQAFWMEDGLSATLIGTLDTLLPATPLNPLDTLGVFGIANGFPLGTTQMLYVATDQCGNIGDCGFSLTLTDTIAPAAVCKNFVSVHLDAQGKGLLSAQSFDNGSSDNCVAPEFRVKWLENNICQGSAMYVDTLHLCCALVGDTLDIEMRVYDIRLPETPLNNTYGMGHFKSCFSKLIVRDTLPPLCTAPPNVTVSCLDFDPDFSAYDAGFQKSCSVDSIATSIDYTQFNLECKKGSIKRTYRVFDSGGYSNACTQTITTNYVQDYYLRFPDDRIVTACENNNLYGEPTFLQNGCELLQSTYDDIIFTIVPDACYKIERHWTVINLCTYNPQIGLIQIPNPNPHATTNNPQNLPGPVISPVQGIGDPWRSTLVKVLPTDIMPTNYSVFWDANANGYQYTQIIKIIDIQDPQVIGACPPLNGTVVQDSTINDPELWNENYYWDNIVKTHDLAESPVDLSITVRDACSLANVNIEYVLYLDIDGDGTQETLVSSATLPGFNTIYVGNNDGDQDFSDGTARPFDFRPIPFNQKYGFAIQETVDNVNNTRKASLRFNTFSASTNYALPQLPYGSHRIRWIMHDGCGNDAECNYNFTVRDGTPPQIQCQDSLTLVFSSPAPQLLYAAQVLHEMSDNYADSSDLSLGLRLSGTGSGFPTDTTLLFNCADTLTDLELWVKDLAGNVNFCTLALSLDTSACNVPPSQNGYVKTETGLAIPDAGIEVTPQTPMLPSMFFYTTTDPQGYYTFQAIPLMPQQELRVSKDIQPLNGVSTADLVAISKHILGIDTLDSPYKMIAADANNSGSITTFDIVEFRKLILGIYDELPSAPSWRFVPKSHVFPDTLNPFQPAFPEYLTAAQLLSGQVNAGDFVGIKIGDVNNTASPVMLQLETDDRRRRADLMVENRYLKSGETAILQFYTEMPMEGCQFTLAFEGLNPVEILPGRNALMEHFSQRDNKVCVAWEKGGLLDFQVRVNASQSGYLAERLQLGSSITPNEALLREGIGQMALAYKDNPTLPFLLSSSPNPFSQGTSLHLNLPVSDHVHLIIQNTDQQVVWEHHGQFEKGMHSLNIPASAFPANGLYICTASSSTETATRKISKI